MMLNLYPRPSKFKFDNILYYTLIILYRCTKLYLLYYFAVDTILIYLKNEIRYEPNYIVLY